MCDEALSTSDRISPFIPSDDALRIELQHRRRSSALSANDFVAVVAAAAAAGKYKAPVVLGRQGRGTESIYTFLGRAKAVVPRHVLNVVHERRVGQNGAFAIQPVDGVLEGQLGAAVLLVLSEDTTCIIRIT